MSNEPSDYKDRPRELFEEVVRLYFSKQYQQLQLVVNANKGTISKNFKSWTLLPAEARGTPERAEEFARTIILLAEMFQKSGDPSLMALITGDPGSNPIEIWKGAIARAAALCQGGRYKEAIALLEPLVPELEKGVGNVAERLLPKVFGHLGIAHYHLGDANDSVQYTFKALNICRQYNDLEGIAAYAGTVVTICSQPGITGKDRLAVIKSMVAERIQALKALGRAEEAEKYAAEFNT